MKKIMNITKKIITEELNKEIQFLTHALIIYTNYLDEHIDLIKTPEESIFFKKTHELNYVTKFKIRYLNNMVNEINKNKTSMENIDILLKNKTILFKAFTMELNSFVKEIKEIIIANNDINNEEYMFKLTEIYLKWRSANRNIIEDYLYEIETK